MLFCFVCWSNITRLLTPPIAARAGTASTSSCIDMLGGESPACTSNTPPGFWAKPGWLADIATSSDPNAASMRRCRLIGLYLLFEKRAYQARRRGLRLVYRALRQGDDEEAITWRAGGISRRRQNTHQRRPVRY